MKKLAKIAAGACAAGMALTMAGCAETTETPTDTSLESSVEASSGFDSSENIPEVLYGPPEMLNGDSEFDPEANLNEDVYGPPEMFDDAEAGETDSGSTEASSQDASK